MSDNFKNQIIPQPMYNVIGHRCVAGLRPENTLIGIEHAAELGLNWIECDARLTKDDKWVIMHDKELDRTTNGSGPVIKKTLAELEELSAGVNFDPAYPSEKIPSLQTFMQHAVKHNVFVNIEVKTDFVNPIEQAILFSEFLKNTITSTMPTPLVSSFDFAFLSQLKKLENTIPIGWIVDSFSKFTCNTAVKNGFTSIHCDVNNITAKNVNEAERNNIPVLLYTVNDPKVAKKWLSNDVYAIFSDRPDLFIE